MRAWLGRRALTLIASRSRSLDRMPAFSHKFTRPLRRDGLDPVPLAAASAGAAVFKHGRILSVDVWLVTDYEHSRRVLNDPGYSTDIRALVGGATDSGVIGGLGFTDPPEHTRLRKILVPEFTSRRLARLEPAIERVVARQIDVLQAAGPVVDIVADFAFPVPFSVICELLGLETEDRARFRQLGHDRFDVNGGGHGMFGAMSATRAVLRDAVARQRSEPGPGLIGSMVSDHGAENDDDALAGLADGVFTGGYETSASMLSLGVLALLRDPSALQRIREDDSAVNGIVDELLRYLSVVQIAFPRFAREDVELSGQRIRAGDMVVCSLSRANRDDVFGAAPENFDPNRTARSHLAFGHGFHRCIGSELARLQLRVAFRGLAHRFPEMTLAVPPGDLQFHDLSIIYGLRTLPVRLSAERPARLVAPATG